MFELPYTFEELPAFTELGFGVGSFSGKAEIKFDETGEWSIGEIWLDGVCRIKSAPYFEHKLIELCDKAHRQLYLSIIDQLENGVWQIAIQDKVNTALEELGVTFRSDRDENSTHYSALSGVAR